MPAIYLSGSDNTHNWRERATAFLSALPVEILDPLCEAGTAPIDLVEERKELIDSADILLAYVQEADAETIMEVYYAWDTFCRVVLVNKSSRALSPWLVYHSTIIVNELEEALEYVQEVNAGI